MKRFLVTSILVGLILSLTACAASTNAPTAAATAPAAATTAAAAVPTETLAPGEQTLTVMTHDSFAASQSVIADFEAQNHVKLAFLKTGDAGAAVNKAILSKDVPLADVFYGTDNTFLSRALQADIFIPYASPALKDIPAALQLDATNRALPVDYGDVCINYDKAYFTDHNVALPLNLNDLAKPEYKNLLVTENPATSSTGLAFLLATVADFGPDKYLDYWKSLKANGLTVVDGWETAYYTNFSGSSGKGAQPLVVSYSSSPAAEVVYATTPVKDSPIDSITAPGTCSRQVEFVGILKGTQKQALAEKFIDFMLGTAFQEDMPLQMYVYPANSTAKLPDVFKQYARLGESPASLSPDEIAKNRDTWIQAWTSTVLQ